MPNPRDKSGQSPEEGWKDGPGWLWYWQGHNW